MMPTKLDPSVLDQVLHDSRNGIIVTDACLPDQPIVFANRAFLEMTGYTEAEVLGRNCRFLQASPTALPDENAESRNIIRTAINGRRSAMAVFRNYRKDSSCFWSEVGISPVFSKDQRLIHFIGIQCDVTHRHGMEVEMARTRKALIAREAARTADLRKTNEQLYDEILERRKAERALRVAERKYRGFFDNAVEGAYQSTAEGQYLSVNPALARMYAYSSPAEMMAAIGNIARDVYIDPGMRQRFQEIIERDGEVRNLEYQVRRRDSVTLWICENARVARNRRGQVLYYEGTIQDITRRKEAEAEATKLERQLLQAQKMEAVGTLAGGIAHDFNNILTAINGHAELAKMRSGDDPDMLDHLGRVLQAAARATDLVRQILAFSRQQEQRRSPLQLRNIVEETLKLLRATIPSTIEFEMSLPSDAPIVLADSTQVHQVLMNLGTNAWHAMRDRPGRLQVRLENFEVDANLAAAQPRLRPGRYARISVSDSGCGIDQATLGRIFEPFFTTKPLGEGTGLGLSVVHGIMQSHDGAITVYSQPGDGTVFHLYFPEHLGDAARVATEGGPIPRGNGERILFVDDEEVLAKLGQCTLEHLGYRVDAKSNVADALDAVRGEPQRFALVVTDQTMPRMTGFEFAGELLQVRPDLPIILTTGFSTNQTAERVRAIGIRKLLLKPHSVRSLGAAVHEVLSGRAGATEVWPG